MHLAEFYIRFYGRRISMYGDEIILARMSTNYSNSNPATEFFCRSWSALTLNWGRIELQLALQLKVFLRFYDTIISSK